MLRSRTVFNLLNAELNPTCHLLAVLGAHHIFHFSELRFKLVIRRHPQLCFSCQLLVTLLDFRLPPRCKWGLRYIEIVGSVE